MSSATPLPEASSSKLEATQKDVSDVFDIMKGNMNKLFAREERLDQLQGQTDELLLQSKQFQHGARTLKRNMWWKNAKLYCIIGSVCVSIIVIIVVAAVLSAKK